MTSPEVGPLFATVLARALDSWWQALGRPDPFVVIEGGAGAGALARDLLATRPVCAPALRYLLVERSDVLRARHGGQLRLEPPSSLLGGAPAGGDDDEEDELAGTGPMVASLAGLPGQKVVGVVLANELLDNLPVLLLERGAGAWFEVRVGLHQGELSEVVVPAAPDLAAEADRFAPHAPDGGRIPLQHAARSWLGRALTLLERGRLVAIDYAQTTASLADRPWREWLRTYRAHGPGGHPLEAPGHQDITCEVATDQLAAVRSPSSVSAQADFLRAHGLEDLVTAARRRWQERAHIGDLEAVKARSTASEAEALTDASGLGGFQVVEWDVT